MSDVIIASDCGLVVGCVYRGPMTDTNMEYRDVAFVVLRETTEDEYRRYAAENSTMDNPPFRCQHWFYAVAMD